MKKRFYILLLLPLLLAIGFIVFTIRTGSAPDWLATATSFFTNTRIASSTAVFTSSAVTQPPPAITGTQPATLTPTPSARPTSTVTQTPTAIATPTPGNVSAGIATATPASEEINDGILKGNHIIRALEVYYLDQSHYPSTLDELVPVYLPALPVTLTNQPYFYRLFDATDPLATEIYWLEFRVAEQEHTVCTYFRRLEYWDCNFASP
jgi:hypothetical protein